MTDQLVAFTEPGLQDETRIGANLRLREAVHRHKAVSREGLLERIFTVLFTGLVYPQIWEDPEIDLEALDVNPDSTIVTIASGGCNVLSYLTAAPARVIAVDLNRAHLALTRLKLAAARHMPSYDDFFRFFGQADEPANERTYRDFLRDELDWDTRTHWEQRLLSGRRRISLFSRGFYRYGLLGFFIGWTHRLASLYGVDFRQLLSAKSLSEQRAFFDAKLAPLFDKKLIRWITDRPASLYGLGIPPSQYASLAAGRAMNVVLRERLEKLTCDFPLADNYFAWQAFGRRYAPGPNASLPLYLQRENFPAVKANAKRTEVMHRSFTEVLGAASAASVDRYVLLDAQDWMSDQQLNELWREISRTARPGARVIFRTAAALSLLPGRVNSEILDRWTYHETESLAWSKRDRSAIYGGFHLYSFKG